jgi:hypothetical protein
LAEYQRESTLSHWWRDLDVCILTAMAALVILMVLIALGVLAATGHGADSRAR